MVCNGLFYVQFGHMEVWLCVNPILDPSVSVWLLGCVKKVRFGDKHPYML